MTLACFYLTHSCNHTFSLPLTRPYSHKHPIFSLSLSLSRSLVSLSTRTLTYTLMQRHEHTHTHTNTSRAVHDFYYKKTLKCFQKCIFYSPINLSFEINLSPQRGGVRRRKNTLFCTDF